MKKTHRRGENRGKPKSIIVNFYPNDPLDGTDAERLKFLNECDSYTDAIKIGIDLLKEKNTGRSLLKEILPKEKDGVIVDQAEKSLIINKKSTNAELKMKRPRLGGLL